jgi:hypothetical protein
MLSRRLSPCVTCFVPSPWPLHSIGRPGPGKSFLEGDCLIVLSELRIAFLQKDDLRLDNVQEKIPGETVRNEHHSTTSEFCDKLVVVRSRKCGHAIRSETHCAVHGGKLW